VIGGERQAIGGVLVLALVLVFVFGFGLVGPVSAAESQDDGFGGKRLAIEGNFLVPGGSLESHQPGPGITLTWEHPLAEAWRTTVTTGYLTLLTKSTPSFQMMPFGAGVKWTPRGDAHGPFLAADASAFVTVESFRFVFGEATVEDDDWAFAFGPSARAGYAVWYLTGDAGYQHLWMGGSSAGCYRFRLGVRF
jgi:hypothetical protein